MKKKLIMFIVMVVIVLVGITFVDVKTYIRYSNPLMDITASYYEKTVNGTTVILVKLLKSKFSYTGMAMYSQNLDGM